MIGGVVVAAVDAQNYRSVPSLPPIVIRRGMHSGHGRGLRVNPVPAGMLAEQCLRDLVSAHASMRASAVTAALRLGDDAPPAVRYVLAVLAEHDPDDAIRRLAAGSASYSQAPR